MTLKNLWLVDVYRASGYPADTQVHKYHRTWKLTCTLYISLKCCDEETGKCASNPMSRQGGEVQDLEESVVGWCPSSVWVPSRHASSRVPAEMEDDMYISLKCCDEETWKCASNLTIVDEG